MAGLKNLVAKKEGEPTEVKPVVAEEEDKPIVTADIKVPEEEEVKPETAEVAEVEGETPRERALRAELTKLRQKTRETRRLTSLSGEDTEPEDVVISKSEAIVFNSFQQDALDEFLEKHSHYNENEDNWQQFLSEYEDRVPIAEYAKRKGVPLTKKLIRQRLESIHNALGIDAQSAKEEGKKELLKTQSAAKVALTASANGERVSTSDAKPRKRILPRSVGGLQSWVR